MTRSSDNVRAASASDLEALHPQAAVFHLEEELLRQDALKLAKRVLVWPQPQLEGLHRQHLVSACIPVRQQVNDKGHRG